MLIAYFDCFSGASGDMILGALVDVGVPFEFLCQELNKLRLPGFFLTQSRVTRSGISAVDVQVHTDDPQEERHLREIEAIIEASELSEGVKSRSKTIFRRIAEAEAKVHYASPEQIHFHEVGGLDCIVDICGACIGLEYLKVERVYVSALPMGYGIIQSAHGLMPIPAPATLELLKGIPLYSVPLEAELVTPTGAGILSTLGFAFGEFPPHRPLKVGYGAGKKDLGQWPNLLRLVVGEQREVLGPPSEIVEIQTNVDDLVPEAFEMVMKRAFSAGALEVFFTPVQMKKNRPGVLITALSPLDKAEAVALVLMKETTTFGVRMRRVERYYLDREFQEVETPYGKVRVKIGRWNSEILTVGPEYEDCRRIAEELSIPFKEVYYTALSLARQKLESVG